MLYLSPFPLKTLVGKVVYEYKLDQTTLLAYTNNEDPDQSWHPFSLAMVHRWRADDGTTLNAGLVAL